MSPNTPAPIDKPGDAPNDCMNRHDKSWGIVREQATPKEPKKRRGNAVMYTGFLPSENNFLKCNNQGRAYDGSQRQAKYLTASL